MKDSWRPTEDSASSFGSRHNSFEPSRKDVLVSRKGVSVPRKSPSDLYPRPRALAFHADPITERRRSWIYVVFKTWQAYRGIGGIVGGSCTERKESEQFQSGDDRSEVRPGSRSGEPALSSSIRGTSRATAAVAEEGRLSCSIPRIFGRVNVG